MSRALRIGLSGVIVVVLGRLAALGRLPRNPLAGIRIPSTMRSDEAWLAGHRAAAGSLTVAGLGPLVAAGIVATRSPDPSAQTVVSRLGQGWLLVWLGVATVRAHRAAQTSPETPPL